MDVFLAYTLLMANNRDAGEWLRILVFVVVGVFWAIGSILKAKANKAGQQDKQEQDQGDQPLQRALRARIQQQRQRVIADMPKPAIEKYAVESQKPQTGRPGKSHEPEDMVKLSKPLKWLKSKPIDIRLKKTEPQIADEPFFDLDNPEQLRRAILHYEILGKPLSLRDR